MFEHAPPSAGEVRALANQLLSWANQLATRPALGPDASDEDKMEVALGMAMAVREFGCLRDRLIPGLDFGNPDWQIVLEMFIQSANGYRIEPDRLALIAYLPDETVGQSLDRLCRAGLVKTVVCPADATKRRLALTKASEQAVVELMLRSAAFFQPAAAEEPEARRAA